MQPEQVLYANIAAIRACVVIFGRNPDISARTRLGSEAF
jgi:hypothetical protein